MILIKVKKETFLCLKMELNTRANGKAICDMGMGSSSGQMAQSTKASGRTTKPMVKVRFGMFMETNTKDDGKETRHTVLANIHT